LSEAEIRNQETEIREQGAGIRDQDFKKKLLQV